MISRVWYARKPTFAATQFFRKEGLKLPDDCAFAFLDCASELVGVPVDDGCSEEVQSGNPEVLGLACPIADFALAADPQGVLQHRCQLRRIRGRPHQDANPRGHGDRQGKGQTAGQAAKTVGKTTERTLANARYQGILDQRSCRTFLLVTANSLSNAEQAKNSLECHSALSRNRPRTAPEGRD